MEHESDDDANFKRCARYSHQRIDKGSGRLGNKKMSGDHPNCNIKIGQNPGNLNRLIVTQTPAEKLSTSSGVKNSQMSKIIISTVIKGAVSSSCNG